MSVLNAYSCALEKAVSLLSGGGVVVVPTETVYGLAADAHQEQALHSIYRIKNRPTSNPLILHYRDKEAIMQDVLFTETAQILAKAFWPGPLTMVLERSPTCTIPLVASAHHNTLAVRVPAHPLFQKLLHLYQRPLAAPSANPSGKLSPTCKEHIQRFFGDSLFVLDGGPCAYGLESTIIDATERDGCARLLREGALAQEDIQSVLGGALSFATKGIEAPGMLLSHYCPLKPLRIHATHVLTHEGLIAFGRPLPGAQETIQLSLAENLEEAAARFFDALHHLDQSTCSGIAVMPIPHTGIGMALNDRLNRAMQG